MRENGLLRIIAKCEPVSHCSTSTLFGLTNKHMFPYFPYNPLFLLNPSPSNPHPLYPPLTLPLLLSLILSIRCSYPSSRLKLRARCKYQQRSTLILRSCILPPSIQRVRGSLLHSPSTWMSILEGKSDKNDSRQTERQEWRK